MTNFTEDYRTIPTKEFEDLMKKVEELEKFRSANRIQVDIKVSGYTLDWVSFGYPIGQYVGRQVILSEIIGANVAGLYEPISHALKHEFDSAMINNQGAIAAIIVEKEEMENMYREIRMAKSDLEFKRHTQKEDVENGTSIWKYLFFGMVILMAIILSARSCQAQTKIQPTYIALEGLYITLQAADTYTTYRGLQQGAREVNPAANYLYKNDLLIPGKIVMTSVTLLACRRIYRDNPRMAYVYMIGANLIYSVVLYNNVQVTMRLKI